MEEVTSSPHPPAHMEPPQRPPSDGQSDTPKSQGPRKQSKAPLIIAITAAVLGLLFICVFGVLLFCDGRSCSVISAVSDPTPTPITANVIIQQPLPTREAGLAYIGEEVVALNVDPPAIITISDSDYAVQVGGVGSDGRWTPVVESEKVAVWLSGTVINYVMALQDSEANRLLMQALERGAPMLMTTESGRVLEFDFSSREVVSITQLDVFAQTMPGLTLVLARNDGSNERMVVRGRYKVSEAAQSIGPGGAGFDGGNVALIGEVVQLGDMQLAVTAFDSRVQTGANFTYFLVDYQIRNDGTIPYDSSQLQFILVDSIGTQYPPSINASQVGNYPPLPQSLGVGQPLQATVGYQIANGIDPNSLGWIVRRLDTGEEIEIRSTNVVVDGGVEVIEVSAEVRLDSARLVDNSSSLLLEGVVINTGTTPVIIDTPDIFLESGGAGYLILSTNPRFPWTIPVGETLPYSVQVQKPINDSIAVFTILGFSWQVDNYR